MDSAESGLLAANPWVARHKLTVDEYYRMAEAGILDPGDRVELIEGEVVEMAPVGTEHHGTVSWLTKALIMAIGDRAIVSVQCPVRLDGQNEPEPDIAVLKRRDDYYRSVHVTPADVLLLIEVAKSSLRFDRAVKRPLYARYGIAEYWIVDLVGQRVEICRDPGKDDYVSVNPIGRDGMLEPLLLPGVTIPVDALLG